MLRHLPNLLSALRLLAAPIAAWAILSDHDTAALLVFAFAGASDGLDGFIARRWGFTSRFGAWLDPAADKFLMLMCFVALWRIAVAPVWLVALVIARDLALAVGWVFARLLGAPIRFETLMLGKISTVVQIGYIGLALLLLAFDRQAQNLMMTAAWTVALFTILSGGAYGLVLQRQLFAGRAQIS
jgi:cardiolipin synthase (CMP-forming)